MSEQSSPLPSPADNRGPFPSHVANLRPSGSLKQPGRAEEQSESHQGSAPSPGLPTETSICSALEPEVGSSWGNFSTKHLTEVLLSRLWVNILSGFAFKHKTAQDPPSPTPLRCARSSSKSRGGSEQPQKHNTLLFIRFLFSLSCVKGPF